MLEQMTNILLDELAYPVGTLPRDVLQASMLVLNGWSKTDCPTGAKTAERILDRLEREADAGNSTLRLCIMHFAVVRTCMHACVCVCVCDERNVMHRTGTLLIQQRFFILLFSIR
jgi:hypothetical protein